MQAGRSFGSWPDRVTMQLGIAWAAGRRVAPGRRRCRRWSDPTGTCPVLYCLVLYCLVLLPCPAVLPCCSLLLRRANGLQAAGKSRVAGRRVRINVPSRGKKSEVTGGYPERPPPLTSPVCTADMTSPELARTAPTAAVHAAARGGGGGSVR